MCAKYAQNRAKKSKNAKNCTKKGNHYFLMCEENKNWHKCEKFAQAAHPLCLSTFIRCVHLFPSLTALAFTVHRFQTTFLDCFHLSVRVKYVQLVSKINLILRGFQHKFLPTILTHEEASFFFSS